MKIDKAIMSVDDNQLYLDFWPLVAKVWKLRFNIEPVLIYFGNHKLDETYGTVKYVQPLPNVDMYLQTLWARTFFTSTEPEITFIISDIDMFPISKAFFIDQLVNIDDNKYVHLYGRHRPIPTCYHVAKGKMFKKVLNLQDSLEQSISELVNSNKDYRGYHMGHNRWGIDEHYCTVRISQYENKDEIVLIPNDIDRRLDRSNWPTSYNIDNYIDCHSVRPVSEFQSEINDVMSRLV